MATIRNEGSTAELAVRRRLWANGIRYRLHQRLPGHPDLAFPGLRIAVFIDGDMWHGNSWRVRGLPSLEAQFPNRTAWWVTKIRRNMDRDRQVDTELAAAGWTLLRYWESDVLADPNHVAREIARRVRGQDMQSYRVIEASPVEQRRLASIRTKLDKARG